MNCTAKKTKMSLEIYKGRKTRKIDHLLVSIVQWWDELGWYGGFGKIILPCFELPPSVEKGYCESANLHTRIWKGRENNAEGVLVARTPTTPAESYPFNPPWIIERQLQLSLQLVWPGGNSGNNGIYHFFALTLLLEYRQKKFPRDFRSLAEP